MPEGYPGHHAPPACLAGTPGSYDEKQWLSSIKSHLPQYYRVYDWGRTDGERWGMWESNTPPEDGVTVDYELLERTLWHPNRY